MNEIADALEKMTVVLALDGVGVTFGLLAIACALTGRRPTRDT